ncbi:MAG: hypothetical protein CMF39_05105 [Legionellaceae bacterium]|nr:hypothetical protein [Legionellaceae bacterium]
MGVSSGIMLTPEAEKVFLQLPGIVVWMNLNEEYLGINPLLAKLQGYKGHDKALGKTCFDMPSPAVEMADHFSMQERFIMNTGLEKQYFTVVEFSNGQNIFVVAKKPLIDDQNNVIGLFVQGVNVTNKSLLKVSSDLTYMDQGVVKKNKYHQFEYEILDQLNNNLTPREVDCLFLLVRGRTTKEIANFLSLAAKTVDRHIENIRLKLGCRNRNEIIYTAFQNGWEKIVSNNVLNILNKGMSWA